MKERNKIKRKNEIYSIGKTAWPDFVGEDFEIKNNIFRLEQDS
jgi:hypothetical protein